MQCDVLLLNGNVIVNESMLTGESVPVTKIPFNTTRSLSMSIPNNEGSTLCDTVGHEVKLDVKEHSKHIIFGGTQVIQTRYYEHEKVKALVLRTGFNTTKGELVSQQNGTQ